LPESDVTSIGPDLGKDRFRFSAKPEDAAAVEALVRASGVFSDEETAIARELVEESLARGNLASGYHFIFADGARGLDGYTCFGRIPGTDGRYELYWIAVRKEIRRSKLAARLLRATEDQIKTTDGAMLIAETSTLPVYAAAHKFYPAQGYRLLAEIADWHADGDGLAIYGKRLE
jgi:ribosomal protein S18 acetylase RimI-like enzyme